MSLFYNSCGRWRPHTGLWYSGMKSCSGWTFEAFPDSNCESNTLPIPVCEKNNNCQTCIWNKTSPAWNSGRNVILPSVNSVNSVRSLQYITMIIVRWKEEEMLCHSPVSGRDEFQTPDGSSAMQLANQQPAQRYERCQCLVALQGRHGRVALQWKHVVVNHHLLQRRQKISMIYSHSETEREGEGDYCCQNGRFPAKLGCSLFYWAGKIASGWLTRLFHSIKSYTIIQWFDLCVSHICVADHRGWPGTLFNRWLIYSWAQTSFLFKLLFTQPLHESLVQAFIEVITESII